MALSEDIFQDLKFPVKYKESRRLVDDCIKLSVSDFPKKLLYATDNDNGILKCKSGSFVIDKCAYTNKKMYIGYEVNLNLEPAEIKIYFTRDINKAPISQTFKIKRQRINYGLRWYFLDSNGMACNTLYLPPNELLWGSKEEHALVYESTKIKKHVGNGLIYAHGRMLKANNGALTLKRNVFYKGAVTKRTVRLIRQYGKYGLAIPDVFRHIADRQLENFQTGKYKIKDTEEVAV
ncbi:hypothetical protein HYV44_02675 [Candidatus Microgenomates bacterium]|nr:hypothetical protein [Candidatus Microgenomates bacterium]